MTRRPPQREFYSIGEVCELFGLKAHVLRYWETQFPSLSPVKSRQGSRLYRVRDLELIALIHRLVRDERYTLEGARTRIEELRREGTAEGLAGETLERAFLGSLRGELERILGLLEPGSG
jgi:DNA-binding transcriptional MerR regulator